MCGIVGAVSARNIVPILVQGLQRLEYRGYDSCGVAVHNGGLKRARSTDRVAKLLAQVEAEHLTGTTGIAHTRWATHGVPAVHNAHPHFSHGPGQGCRRQGRPHRPGPQRDHRELPGAARRAPGQGLRLQQPDRHRGDLPPGRQPLRRRPVRRREVGRRATARRLRDRGDLQGRTAPRRRRARRIAAGPGRGRGGRRELPGQRRDGPGRRDRPDRLPGRGRRGRPATGQVLGGRSLGQAGGCAPSRRCRPTAARPNWGRTATTCKRKSSSSRARWPTRWKACRASCPSCSATALTASSRKSIRC